MVTSSGHSGRAAVPVAERLALEGASALAPAPLDPPRSLSAVSQFLKECCPEPQVILDALQRSGMRSRRDVLAGEFICRRDEPATACWLILDGTVEIQFDESNIRLRRSGELIGEQALLQTLSGKDGRRTADMKACGPVQLLCIDAAFQENLTLEERYVWILTLAAVVNHKLEEATVGRSRLRKESEHQETLLRRFADENALGIVKLAAEDQFSPIQRRKIVVWFSDIANFSRWAADKEPAAVAQMTRRLLEAQIDLIRAGGGTVDKLLGDGVMAFWFIDTPRTADLCPRMAIECAQAAIDQVREIIAHEGYDDQLDIRVGLHCGEAAFGDFGARERIAVTVLGSTVNLAARYEQATSAQLGPLRVSPELKACAESDGRGLPLSGPFRVRVKHGVDVDIFSN